MSDDFFALLHRRKKDAREKQKKTFVSAERCWLMCSVLVGV